MTVTVTSALAGPATARYSNVYGALVDLGVLSGLGAQDVTGSGDPVAPILNASEFYAPLTNSLILTRGTGNPTYYRATKAWEFGYAAAANAGADQVLIEVATNTPRFGGARYDSGTWYNTYADGSAISASSLLGYHAEGARTNSLLYSRDLRCAASDDNRWLSTQSGSELCTNGDFSASTGWSLGSEVTISGGKLNFNTTANRFAYRYNAITVGKTYAYSITIDSISAGAVRVVCGRNGRIFASAGTYTGTIYAAESAHIGVLCVGATTAVVDDVSVKEAAIQVTTCTGIDNAANSASTLTAGAADATILQTVSPKPATAARSFSAYVTRRTGVGPIYVTRDGFATEVDISGSLQVGSLADSTKRYRVKIENTTVDGPVVGFKIATSGDAIDVDVCQDEAGSEAWSPIITTTAAVTRNADAETFPTASNWSDTAGWALATVQGESWANATGTAIGNGTNGLKLSASNSGIVAYDGTNTVNGPAGSPSGAEKLAMTWGSGALQAASGGVAGSAGSYDGAWGLATVGIGTSQGNVYIKDVYIGQSALTPTQIAQVTA